MPIGRYALVDQGKGVRVDGRILPARSRERAFRRRVGRGHGRVRPRDSAQAFDFFGLWGSDESPPPVSRTAISYAVTVDVAGGDSALKNAVTDASSLYKLRKDPPPDGDALARRAESDFGPIIDAMWGAGYYDATVTISIDRASLSILSSDIAGFARAAESYRNRAVAPVTITVDPGPLFTLRSIRVLGPDGAELSEAECRGGSFASSPATPRRRPSCARRRPGSSTISARGRPLAKIASVAPVVDHAAHVMDVTFTIDPGPVAPFGEATMNGPNDFDPRHRALLPLYRARRPLFAARDRRRAEHDPPDPGGRRGADHRGNGARRLGPPAVHGRRRGPAALRDRRLGEIFDHQRSGRPGLLGGPQCLRRRRATAPAGRRLLCAALVHDLAGHQKLLDPRSRMALLGELPEARLMGHAERPPGRRARRAHEHQRRGLLRLRGRGRRRDRRCCAIGSARISGSRPGSRRRPASRRTALGRVNYTLVGVPVSANYDTTDSKLDPTRGVRLNASVAGYPTALGSTVDLVQGKARASAYYSLDPDSRFVLAGLVGLGAMGGAASRTFPPTGASTPAAAARCAATPTTASGRPARSASR